MSITHGKIQIGFCNSPHGIKGEFSFSLFNEESVTLKKDLKILLVPKNEKSSLDKNGEYFKISQIKYGNKVIVSLEEVQDRNKVEKMIPFEIYVEKEDLPKLDEDEFYVADLIGLNVVDFDNKQVIGKVIDFYENGQQVVLKIKNEKETFDILFIESFIKEIDIETGIIEIVVPEMIE